SPVGGLGFGGGFGGWGWPGYGGYGGWGWPGYGGYGGWGWPGYGGYGGYGGWGGSPYGWGGSSLNYMSGPVATTSFYTMPYAGIPYASLGGLPTRWHGVDLSGVGNLASYPAYSTPATVATPR